MSNKIPFTADDAITLEMLNSFVRDSQIEHLGNGEISLMSKSAIQNALATKADKSYFTKFIFNDEGVTSLIDGYTYYGRTINHTVSSGTYYFYNCTGTLTVSGESVKVYATNCPNLNIESNYSATVFCDGVGLLYDKNSKSLSLNWGYPSGIKVASRDIYKDFTSYRHVIVSGTLASGTTGIVLVGSNTTLIGQSSGKYIGRLTVWVEQDHIGVTDAREWDLGLFGSPVSINDYDNSQNFFISKIYGVLK